MNIFSVNLKAYMWFLISLLFLSSCAASLNEAELEGKEIIGDSSVGVLLITNDDEIGAARLGEFKQIQIKIAYLNDVDLSTLERYEIVYLGSDTLDEINDEVLHRWRDSTKLIVGIDTQPTKLVFRLSVPAYRATPIDLDLNFLPDDKFLASGYHQHENGHGVNQDFFSSVFHLHRAMSVKQANVNNPTPTPDVIEAESINWTLYEEESDYFSIQYPQDWSIEPPVDLDSQSPVTVWQFRGEQTSPHAIQGVTLGRYAIPIISDDISWESWLELVDNNQFEFERLRMESIEIDGRDAYAVHNRYLSPEQDSYVTYMRCQNRVWFLQAADVDLESTKIEEIYDSMRDSLALSCGE